MSSDDAAPTAADTPDAEPRRLAVPPELAPPPEFVHIVAAMRAAGIIPMSGDAQVDAQAIALREGRAPVPPLPRIPRPARDIQTDLRQLRDDDRQAMATHDPDADEGPHGQGRWRIIVRRDPEDGVERHVWVRSTTDARDDADRHWEERTGPLSIAILPATEESPGDITSRSEVVGTRPLFDPNYPGRDYNIHTSEGEEPSPATPLRETIREAQRWTSPYDFNNPPPPFDWERGDPAESSSPAEATSGATSLPLPTWRDVIAGSMLHVAGIEWAQGSTEPLLHLRAEASYARYELDIVARVVRVGHTRPPRPMSTDRRRSIGELLDATTAPASEEELRSLSDEQRASYYLWYPDRRAREGPDDSMGGSGR